MKVTRNQLKELIRQSIKELKFGSKAQYDKYKKQHKIKSGTTIDIGGKKTTHKDKPLPKGSKASRKKADKLAAKFNAKMDRDYSDDNYAPDGGHFNAAQAVEDEEEALKKKKKNKGKSLGDFFAGKVKKNIKKINKARKQGRKTTVKEVKRWMKSLEENRYKKTYNSDARRVSWLVNNNLSEDYDTMPKSMRKKWSKAAYGRERYLAKEFIKHLESKQMNEQKLKKLIKKIIVKEG